MGEPASIRPSAAFPHSLMKASKLVRRASVDDVAEYCRLLIQHIAQFIESIGSSWLQPTRCMPCRRSPRSPWSCCAGISRYSRPTAGTSSPSLSFDKNVCQLPGRVPEGYQKLPGSLHPIVGPRRILVFGRVARGLREECRILPKLVACEHKSTLWPPPVSLC